MVDKSVNQNPFEFGIFQRVRRWFSGDQNGAALDADIERRIFPEIKTDPPPMPECKPPAFRNGLTRIGTKVPPPPPEYAPEWRKMADSIEAAMFELRSSRAALIAVIEQWGPITFADETIEANKKKKISIKRENGFVKFSIGESNDQRTNGTAASVQRFSGDTGESGDGSTEGQLQADASEAPRCDSGRVWYDFKYTESDLPRD